MTHQCPECGGTCLSSLQKLLVSSASSTSGKTFGKEVSSRCRHRPNTLVPCILVLATLELLELDTVYVLLIGLALLAVAAFVQLRFLPLSKTRF